MFDEESFQEPPRRYSSHCLYSIRRSKCVDEGNPGYHRFSRYNLTPNANDHSIVAYEPYQTLYRAQSDHCISEKKRRSGLKAVSNKFVNVFKYIKKNFENEHTKNFSACSKTDQNIPTVDLPTFLANTTLSTENYENEGHVNTSSDPNSISLMRVNNVFIKRRSLETRNALLSAKNYDNFILPNDICNASDMASPTISNCSRRTSKLYINVGSDNNSEPGRESNKQANETTDQNNIYPAGGRSNSSQVDISNDEWNKFYSAESNLKKFPTIQLSKLEVENKNANQPPSPNHGDVQKGKLTRCKKLLNLTINKTSTSELAHTTLNNLYDGDEYDVNDDNLVPEDIFQTVPSTRNREKNRNIYKKKKKNVHKRMGSIPTDNENYGTSIDTKSILSFRLSSQKSTASTSKFASLTKGRIVDRTLDDDNAKNDKKIRRNDPVNIPLVSKNSTFRKKIFRSIDHVCYTCKDSLILNSVQTKFSRIFSVRKQVSACTVTSAPNTTRKNISFFEQKTTSKYNNSLQETVDSSLKSGASTDTKENNIELEINSNDYLSLTDCGTNERLSDCELPCTSTNDEAADDELMNQFSLPENFKQFLDFIVLQNVSNLTFIQEKLSVNQFVEQLNYLDRRYLLLIEWEEIKSGAWLSKNKHENAKNIMQSIDYFNRISKFIASTIISTKKVNRRRKIITFYINVCEELYNMKNFNGLQEVLGALSMQAIYRLEETWKGIQPNIIKKYDTISTFMDSMNNFKEYRDNVTNAIEEQQPFIPFMGVFLSDVNAHISYNKVLNSKNKTNSPPIKSKAKSNDNEEIPQAIFNKTFTHSYRNRFSAHQFFKHLSLIDSDYWYRSINTDIENNTFEGKATIEDELTGGSFYSSKRMCDDVLLPNRKKKIEKSYSTACTNSYSHRKAFIYDSTKNSNDTLNKCEEQPNPRANIPNKENEKSAEYLRKLENTFSAYQQFAKDFQATPCKVVCSFLLCCHIPDEETLYKESCELEPPNK